MPSPTPTQLRFSLGFETKPGLAVGAYLKNTVCAVQGSEAFVSSSVGNLDHRQACDRFHAIIADLLDTLQITPQWIATDLHPDFYSTRFAQNLAETHHLPLIEVQHHHAHIGAIIVEHQLTRPVLGLALDGYGLGNDGSAWGGELLRVDKNTFERVGHLHPLPLPGGDKAAREPWRMAVAVLFKLNRRSTIRTRFGPQSAIIETMIEKGLNTPYTSSAGRLFDAAAGLLGVDTITHTEGESAVKLEKLAASFGDVDPIISGYSIHHNLLNMMPLLAFIADQTNIAYAAALFHATFAHALAEWALRAAIDHNIDSIILGGGCFQNRILSKLVRTLLKAQNMNVFEAVHMSPGDASISLGQAWVAAHLAQQSHAL